MTDMEPTGDEPTNEPAATNAAADAEATSGGGNASADADAGVVDAGKTVKQRSRAAKWARRIGVLFGLTALYFLLTFVDIWFASRRVAVDPSQAAVVLGAAQYDGEPSPVLQARLDRAAELFLEQQVSMVVVTGGSQEGDRTTEAKSGYDYLRQAGVPDAQLRLEVDGTSTYESLAATSRFLRREDVDEVILVTSSYHARRVQLVAEELGLEAQVSVTSDTSAGRLARETVAVGVGRLISFRRLDWIRP